MKLWPLTKKRKIIFGIILFFALVFFSVPRIARIYIVNNGPALVGRQISIGKIRFNYFSGTLRIKNLAIYEDNSTTIFTSFKKLKINLDYLPLLKNEIYVRSISLDNLYCQILQDGDKFNFYSLGPPSDTSEVEADTAVSPPMKYTLKNINITNSFVKYLDVPLDNTIALNKVGSTVNLMGKDISRREKIV